MAGIWQRPQSFGVRELGLAEAAELRAEEMGLAEAGQVKIE